MTHQDRPPSRPGEFDLIARYFAPIAGAGGLGLLDDAAILTPPPGCDLVISKDALVADVHFFADDPPADIARKALRVNLSDIAAKGARPLGFLLGLGLPDDWREDWLADFARGLGEDAGHWRCPLLGGDTVKAGPRLFLSVTIFGAVPRGQMIRRSGGRPGDILYVTGTIGDAALGLMLRQRPEASEWSSLEPEQRAYLLHRYLLPSPRIMAAPLLRDHANASMDISDGLIGDLSKIAQASGCGMTLNLADIPLSSAARVLAPQPALRQRILTGGDDYEIACAIPPEQEEAFLTKVRACGVAMTKVGMLTTDTVRLLDAEGQEVEIRQGSYAHFSA